MTSPRLKRTMRLVWVLILFWALYGAVHYLALLPAITDDERAVMALATAVRALTGAAVAWLTALLAWRRGTKRLEPLWLVVAAGFVWMIVDRAILVSVAAAFDLSIPWDRFPRGVDLQYFFVLGAWLAGVYATRALHAERHLRERMLAEQVVARDARLAGIAARLQPHFLFNALNTARALVAEDTERAREMLTRIAGFLRYAIDIDADAPTSLRSEIEAMRSYLWIEQARFEDRLQVDVDIDPALGAVAVPALVLQPLVENAVQHAAPDADVVHLRVRGTRADGKVRITVQNPGSLGPERADGAGLAIARARLAQLYGDDASISLTDADGTVTAELRIENPRMIEA